MRAYQNKRAQEEQARVAQPAAVQQLKQYQKEIQQETPIFVDDDYQGSSGDFNNQKLDEQAINYEVKNVQQR